MRASSSLRASARRQRLRDSEVRKQAGFLNHVTSAPPQTDRVPFSRRFSFDPNLTSGWHQQMIHQPERGRLAATRFAQQHQRFALADCETQVIDDRSAAVDRIAHAAEFDERVV